MSGACARELPPLDVARGCHRCGGLVRRGQEPLALQRSRSPAQEPGWPRRALSFLSEDGSGDSDSWVALGDIPEAGPLSSTRRSLLVGTGDSAVPWRCPQEPLGDSAVPWRCPQEPRGDSAVPWRCPQEPRGDSAVPWRCPQEPRGDSTVPWRCPQEPRGDSAVPWRCPQEPLGDSAVPSWCPQEPRGDSAVPLPPLASSTLLWDRHPPQEPPPSALGTRTGCPLPVPCPRVAPGVSPRRHQGGILGTHAMSPRSPLPSGGCSVAPGSCGDTAGDIPGGWRGAVPSTGVTEAERGDRAGFGDTGHSDSLGDSGDSFVSARESLGGSGAGGAQPGEPSGGAAPRHLGRGLSLGRDSGQDLGRGLGSGQDLEQDLGRGLGSGQDLGRDLGRSLGSGQDLEQDLGRGLGSGQDSGQDLGRGLGSGQDLGRGLGSGQDLEQDLGSGQDLGRDLCSGAAPQIPESCWDLGGLLAPLGGSPRRCPDSPGDVTPRRCDNFGDRHVTPRSRSRLRAVAARLRSCSSSPSPSSSSSSSVPPEPLPMSPRPPGVAVTSPPRRCVTPGDRDGTGGSWGDTQTVPGVSPGGGSAPKSGHRVLRGLGDKGHPQNCSGSGPRRFGDKGHPQNCSGSGPRGFGDKGHPQNCSGSGPRGFGDKGHPQNCSGSGPRGFGDKGHPQKCSGSGPRGFGDKGHPQNSLPPARGSPKSSRGLPEKRRHPQKSPPATRGPPSATSSPRTEGGSGWQRHSPLGTPSVPPSPCGDSGTPSVPPSPCGDSGTPSVPPSPCGDSGTPSVPPPPACATPRSEDATREPRECRSPAGGTGRGGRVSPSQPELGDNPGAVTALEGQRGWPEGGAPGARGRHSPELAAALRTGRAPDCAREELALSQHFQRQRLKSSFNYLLLDPRVTRDLPRRSPALSPAQQFRDFVAAVFYVGKGTRARPWWHLRQARAQQRRGTRRGCPKVQRILEIWDSGQGVVPLLCFPHRAPAEALTRESCMLEALGLPSLTNARRGQCHGPAVSWPGERRRRLGVTLLHRALGVLLAQGECQLYPGDIPG